jgi:hypothetical protein
LAYLNYSNSTITWLLLHSGQMARFIFSGNSYLYLS